ncbi:MAG: OmpA/MotB family protein, partial [Rhodospirillales bacterium]
RARMLSNVERSLMDIGTKVEVFPDTGVLRLPEELLFPSGSAELYPAARDDLAFLGHYLRQILPCYATAPAGTETGQCAPDPGGRLEVVMIEGHTDDRPLRDGARFRNNWELSAARAISVFQALVREGEVLPNLKNDRGDRLIAVSGYGDNRPIADNETPEGRSKNRRIDFRFIMSTPDVRPQDAVEEALRPVR